MEEKSLQTDKKVQVMSPNKYKANMRGRPTTGKTILFSPQPKSIVAQLLLGKKIETCDTPRPVESTEHTETADLKECSSVSDESERPLDFYSCGNCSYRTDNMKEYKKHLTRHKQFNCDFHGCNYVCKLSSNLIKHKRVHTDERPYLCDRCSFRSNFINSLKAHRRIHTTERPYQCKHCDYKCNSSSNLKKHCLYKHPEIPITCN